MHMHAHIQFQRYLQSFMLIPLIVLELCPRQSSKCKNKQRAIIQKLGKADLWFLCTAHLLNEIYLHTKFHVDTSYSFPTPGKLSLHFKIVVHGKTSERHFRDRVEGLLKRIIVSVVYIFVLLFI
jgi:hypothetical protein